jgi:hypothetical protein
LALFAFASFRFTFFAFVSLCLLSFRSPKVRFLTHKNSFPIPESGDHFRLTLFCFRLALFAFGSLRLLSFHIVCFRFLLFAFASLCLLSFRFVCLRFTFVAFALFAFVSLCFAFVSLCSLWFRSPKVRVLTHKNSFLIPESGDHIRLTLFCFRFASFAFGSLRLLSVHIVCFRFLLFAFALPYLRSTGAVSDARKLLSGPKSGKHLCGFRRLFAFVSLCLLCFRFALFAFVSLCLLSFHFTSLRFTSFAFASLYLRSTGAVSDARKLLSGPQSGNHLCGYRHSGVGGRERRLPHAAARPLGDGA